MRWTDHAPVRGDMIRVPVRFYYHYGIFVDENTVIQLGLPDNGDTPPEQIKVMITDIDAFANGSFVEKGEISEHEEKKKCRTPEQVIALAMSRVGETGYHILHNNCEHFVYSCMFGEKRSFLDDVRAKIRKKLKETE